MFAGRRHLANKCWRRLEDVLKTSCEDVLKTLVEDVLQTRLEDVLEDKKLLCWRRLQDVLEKQRCLLGRGRLWQIVQCQLSFGLPKINLFLFCGSIEECLSGTIICLELDGGAGKYTKKDGNKTLKDPILRWLLSPLPHRQKICFGVDSDAKL